MTGRAVSMWKALASLSFAAAACGGQDDGGAAAWVPTWSDEFNEPGPPNPRFWNIEIDGRGGGNQESQYYTARPENVHVDETGQLVITARREPFEGRAYTSARLDTRGKFEQAYGRFEARIKLPVGKGMWPAFWLLGGNIGSVGWPACGEIDIMENRGAIPSTVLGSLHGPGFHGGNALSEALRLPMGNFADDFHVYAVEWTPTAITFLVDGTRYHSVAKDGLRPGATWVFDHPFFIIVNLAVGGTFGGEPNETTVFPQELRVDWIRAYRRDG